LTLDARTEGDAAALECVRQYVEAENRRDLVHVRALLHDDCAWRVNGHLQATSAGDAARAMAQQWAAAPNPSLCIADVGSVDDWVTVRYQLRDTVHPGTGRRVDSLLGYTIFEVFGGRILRIWQYVSDPTPPEIEPAVEETTEAVGTAPANDGDHAVEAMPLRAALDAAAPGPPAEPVLATRPRRRGIRRALAIVAVAITVAVNELALSAPVVATAASLGARRALAILTPVYFVGGLVASALVYWAYGRQVGDRPGMLERFARNLSTSRRGDRVVRVLQRTRVVGFLLAALIVGGPLLTWALRSMGVRRSLPVLISISCAIWAIAFVGMYAGVGSVLF
jgi:hypothetical protein